MSQEMPIVYPVTNTVPTSSHSTNGSYGSVFIVLAVIVTISAFACFLGRLCNKRQNVAKPSVQNQDKDTKPNGFQMKDGDIEFGYDKRFASAKVNEPTMARPDSFAKPNIVQPNTFHEPTVGQPSSFHKPNKVQPSSFHKPNKVQPSSFHEPHTGRPNSFQEPTMGRPQEPTMGQSNLFQTDADQMRFGDDRGNGINFKIRTRAQRY